MASKNKELFIVVGVEADDEHTGPDYYGIVDYDDAVYSTLKEAEQAALYNAANDNGQWFVAKIISRTSSEIKVVNVA